MLYNQHNQPVHIADKFNSKDNPNMFKHLVEHKIPKDCHCGKMFNLGERACFKQIADDIQ